MDLKVRKLLVSSKQVQQSNMGGSRVRMSYCLGSEDSKHGSFKMLSGRRKKGHKSEAQSAEGSKRVCSQYTFHDVLF